VFNHPERSRYCSSRISSGTVSRAKTLFTTIETRVYSSGQKNTLAIIDEHDNSRTESTCRWNRWLSRSAVRNRGCLRSRRMGNCGGRSGPACRWPSGGVISSSIRCSVSLGSGSFGCSETVKESALHVFPATPAGKWNALELLGSIFRSGQSPSGCQGV